MYPQKKFVSKTGKKTEKTVIDENGIGKMKEKHPAPKGKENQTLAPKAPGNFFEIMNQKSTNKTLSKICQKKFF